MYVVPTLRWSRARTPSSWSCAAVGAQDVHGGRAVVGLQPRDDLADRHLAAGQGRRAPQRGEQLARLARPELLDVAALARLGRSVGQPVRLTQRTAPVLTTLQRVPAARVRRERVVDPHPAAGSTMALGRSPNVVLGRCLPRAWRRADQRVRLRSVDSQPPVELAERHPVARPLANDQRGDVTRTSPVTRPVAAEVVAAPSQLVSCPQHVERADGHATAPAITQAGVNSSDTMQLRQASAPARELDSPPPHHRHAGHDRLLRLGARPRLRRVRRPVARRVRRSPGAGASARAGSLLRAEAAAGGPVGHRRRDKRPSHT
jgi:hypothetical protein